MPNRTLKRDGLLVVDPGGSVMFVSNKLILGVLVVFCVLLVAFFVVVELYLSEKDNNMELVGRIVEQQTELTILDAYVFDLENTLNGLEGTLAKLKRDGGR